MLRDNFSAKVIKGLRERVACKCSNPDYQVPNRLKLSVIYKPTKKEYS
jgi:hypothetical protein